METTPGLNYILGDFFFLSGNLFRANLMLLRFLACVEKKQLFDNMKFGSLRPLPPQKYKSRGAKSAQELFNVLDALHLLFLLAHHAEGTRAASVSLACAAMEKIESREQREV